MMVINTIYNVLQGNEVQHLVPLAMQHEQAVFTADSYSY